MHRRVFVEGLDRHVVIGACKLPKHIAGPRLRDFMPAGVAYPQSPASCDWTAKAMTVLMNVEGNDQYGDCVFAEDAHYIATLTGNANTLYSYTQESALADYAALTGFNPSDPSTDQGADPIADLTWRVQKGYADGSKDAGYALVDGTNQAEVEYAVNEFGNLKMWLGLPDGIVNAMPSQSGFVWDTDRGPPDQNNGHAIGGYGYNPKTIQLVNVTAQGPLVATWGMLGIVTWPALASWCIPSQGGGLAVRVSMDWVNKQSGQTPSGVNAAAMVTAFNLYFGGKVPVPAPPTPVPVPPGPTSSVTLAEAVSWADQGIDSGFPLLTHAQAKTLLNAGLTKHWPKS